MKPGRLWTWAGYALVLLLLAVGFRAYLSPSMLLNWETFMTMCGF
ncbi:MAG: hypothetical protein ABN482_03075 [Corticimicrobacter sp.]|nr:hypothetical protein [Corticimicrobacter populi]